MYQNKSVAAIVLAAGKGSRMGKGTGETSLPKQFLPVGGIPLVTYSLLVFEQFDPVDAVFLVTGPEEMDYCRDHAVVSYSLTKVKDIVGGGAMRHDSVYAGILAAKDYDYVMIHDGARPMIDGALLERNLAVAAECGAAVTAVPSKDTIRICDSRNRTVETPDRSGLWAMQTPQTFLREPLLAAFEKMYETGKTDGITDDAMVLERFGGGRAVMAEGSYRNIKITTPEDLVLMEMMLKRP